MPSGWTRFLLESFEFPFEVVYPQALNEGDLVDKFDVLIFVDGGIPSRDQRDREAPDFLPEEYEHTVGQVSVSTTVPLIKEFLERGGTVVAIGSSTVLAQHLGLPISDAFVEIQADGSTRPLPTEKFYVPGSVLRAQVDNTNPLAFGLPQEIDLFFQRSPAFKLGPEAAKQGVEAVAWFGPDSLRSGWAWGEAYLEDSVAIIDADVGRGKLFLFGPEVAFRAQPHGTFKFLFNGIYYGRSEPVTLEGNQN
jgi:hypothetical protein